MEQYFICQAHPDAPRACTMAKPVECDFDTAMWHADMAHKHTGEPSWVELEDGTVVYETK